MEHITFVYCCMMDTKLCGGCHASQAKHPGAKDLMVEVFRDSCVWGRCLLTAYSACNNKVSNYFPETLQKGWADGSWNPRREKNWQYSSAKVWREKEKQEGPFEAVVGRTGLTCGGRVWSEQSTTFCKLPFVKCKVLTYCMVHFVVSLPSLETRWEWGNFHMWCQDRQTYVRTASLQLLSIARWSSHADAAYSCHCRAINFAARVCALWTHISVWCVI